LVVGSVIGTGIFALPSALAGYGPISLVAFGLVTVGALALALTFLVPRLIPTVGLIGAPLLIASAVATLFNSNDSITRLAVVATVPIFLWELSLAVWLVVRGFQPSPTTTPTMVAMNGA
jgi:hypothetical protein